MGDDIHGADIGSENDDAVGEDIAAKGRGCGWRGFADGFDAFLDTALECLVFGGCEAVSIDALIETQRLRVMAHLS